MSRRGHTLPAVMAVITAAFIASSLFSTRFLSLLSTRRADTARWQAHWLATSACAGHEQTREVRTELGVAKVSRRGDTAEARLADVHARVRCEGGP